MTGPDVTIDRFLLLLKFGYRGVDVLVAVDSVNKRANGASKV